MDSARRSTLIGTLFILAAITTWGAYFPFAKIVLRKLSPASFLIVRLGIGTVTLYLLNAHFRTSLRLERRDFAFIILAGVVGIVLHQLVQLQGLKVTSATNTGWILTLIPPVTGILGWFWLRERVALHKIIGLLIAMFGVTLLVTRGHLDQLSLGAHHGDLFVLLSVATWSVYTVMLKSRLGKYQPLAIAFCHMTVGFVAFGIVGTPGLLREIPTMDGRDWLITTLIGVIPSGLAYYWWAAGLQRLSALDTSMFILIEAIVASLAGWIVLDEAFTWGMLVGTMITIMGVWFAQSQWLDRKEWGIGRAE